MDDLFDEGLEEDERETQRLETLAREAIDDRREKERTAKIADKAKDKADASEERLWEALDEAKTKTTTLELGEGYGDVQIGKRVTTTARILNEAELNKALKAEPGLADQVLAEERKIRKKVLNQIVRERAKAGKPLPDGADLHESRYVQLSFK